MHDKNINVANFFWVGKITQYEVLSFNSFLNNGFKVNLWTYFSNWNDKNTTLLDENINLLDASKIVSESYLMKFTQDNQKSNMSSFSNLFRFELLRQGHGWWFDSDCVCLRNVKDFERLVEDKKFVFGLEYENYVGSSVAFISDSYIAELLTDETYSKLNTNDFNFYWGEIGPDLITEVLEKENLIHEVYPEEFFFKVPAQDFHLFFNADNKTKQQLFDFIDNSYVSHTWNEMFRKFLIDKEKLPPKNSFLYDQMKIYNLQLDFDKMKSYKKYLKIRFLPFFSLLTRFISRLSLIIRNRV